MLLGNVQVWQQNVDAHWVVTGGSIGLQPKRDWLRLDSLRVRTFMSTRSAKRAEVTLRARRSAFDSIKGDKKGLNRPGSRNKHKTFPAGKRRR